MKIRWSYILLTVAAIILAGNLLSAIFHTLTEGPAVIYTYETRNAEFQYTVDPAGGPDVATMEREFRKFLSVNPTSADRELYRVFERDPWKFWNWYHYLTSELYDYPYKEPAANP